MTSLRSLVLALTLPLATTFAATSAQAAAMKVSVAVDTRACATVPVQCAGFSFVPAGGTNNNPFPLRVTVVNGGGLPVNGLTAANFTFTNGIVPAGGGAAVLCPVATCGPSNFAAAGPGLYQIWVMRGPAGNWTPGGYAAALQVNAGANNGEELVAFTIPN